MIRIFGTVLAALAGLAFGSFLNVCLTRWPAGESVVEPRSHCRSCNRALAWWENVPIASWLALRGHCRTCGAGIGWRYPLVELAVGALWALEGLRLATTLTSLDTSTAMADPWLNACYAIFLAISRALLYWLLIALAALDAEALWLPDWLTLPGTLIGFCLSFVPAGFQRLPGFLEQNLLRALVNALLAIAIPAGLVILIRWSYWLVRRREGIGLGDAKLMAMLGAWLGLPEALLAFTIGVVLGAITAFIALAIPAARRGPEHWAATKLPLGTFLCIGGIIAALWGHQILTAYLRWSGLS